MVLSQDVRWRIQKPGFWTTDFWLTLEEAVMPRRKIEFKAGEFYHLYNRGNNRERIFFGEGNYLYFLKQTRKHLADCASIIAYCLMPNHYHLLVRLKNEHLSQRMHAFSLAYTKAINNQQERVGSLFQGRFQAIHVDRVNYLLHLSRYIHLNPVAAGLVASPELWLYSSFRDYIGMRDGSLPDRSILLSEFSSRTAYQKFVEDGIGKTDDVIQHSTLEDECDP